MEEANLADAMEELATSLEGADGVDEKEESSSSGGGGDGGDSGGGDGDGGAARAGVH